MKNLFAIKHSNFLVFIILIFIFVACYENKEGCLDINATNFNVDADIRCSDCCTYPSLRLNILHRIKDAQLDTFYNFMIDQAITLDSMHFFNIKNIRYYISDIKLKRANGTLVGVNNEIKLSITAPNADTIPFFEEDNFALISRRTPRNNNIGTLSQNGDFVGVQFKIGLAENINQTNPNLVPLPHPLHISSEMYDAASNKYIFNQIELLRTAGVDTIPTIVNVIGDEYVRTIDLPFPFNADIGFNITLTIRVDYREWFKQIDIKNENIEDFVTKVTAGLVNSFELVSVNKSVN
jgi:hypothetical protein